MCESRKLIDRGLEYETGGALDRALAYYQEAAEAAKRPALAAEALTRQAHVHRKGCDWAEAIDAARRSAEIAQAAGSDDEYAAALSAEAVTHQSRGDFTRALELLQRSCAVAQDDRIRGIALQNLGSITAQQDELEVAERYFVESYQCFERSGYDRGQAVALANRAAIALDRGQFEVAQGIADEAVTMANRVEDLDLLGVAVLNGAEAAAALGDYNRAEELASTALGYYGLTGNGWRRVRCLTLLGNFTRAQDDLTTARRFYEAGLRLAGEVGVDSQREVLQDRLAELKAAGT